MAPSVRERLRGMATPWSRSPPPPVPGRAVVLLYHRIAAPDTDLWHLCVSPKSFEEQLAVVAARFNPMTLRELVGRVADKRAVPPRTVVITFDDGYRDNLYEARTLLAKASVPGTVFVTTAYIDSTRDFWWDELERFVLQVGGAGAIDHRALRRRLQRLSHQERCTELDRLWADCGAPRPPATNVLSSDELCTLAGDGMIEIGAHTATHPRLSQQSARTRLAEIRASREYLLELLGSEIDSFSYPHGDFDPRTIEAVRAAGFRCACTTRESGVTDDTDLFELPRLEVGEWSGDLFEQRVQSLLV